MPDYTEDNVLSALKDIESGLSQRKAAQRWKVPRATLQKRLSGGVTRRQANEHKQRLSKDKEHHLAQWILASDELGFPPSYQEVRDFAAKVVKAGGDDEPLGKAWLDNFLRRNSQLKNVKWPHLKTAEGTP
ncbi:tc5 transposase DNA-binding domain-containing protein [Trichoderma breve]|uniref:Tc5 transposase DNA-binding domain-containing protein n=1 Tax=Trichoderma breve TaxID=2034170 RepID=A0A9W9E664_9HYPO|nr:tc5 transposase DNA-binding domain-containing protein [Trichoderma breve]KAJ4859594.1 tc5 transposase DNA-binding domain-containing protein [Trichoderma breve]